MSIQRKPYIKILRLDIVANFSYLDFAYLIKAYDIIKPNYIFKMAAPIKAILISSNLDNLLNIENGSTIKAILISSNLDNLLNIQNGSAHKSNFYIFKPR